MTTPDMTTDELSSQVDSLYEQHLKTKLRGARRNLALVIEQFTRSPNNPRVNERVDEASREVALIEREITVYRAQRRDRSRPVTTPTDLTSREGEMAPNETFRAAQLAKATQAIRAGGSTPQAGADSGAPVVSSALPDDIAMSRAMAAPPQAAPATPPGKTCPQCGSRALIQAQRCKCGYDFTGVAESSSDGFLTRDEVLALRRGTGHQPP